MSTTNLKSLVRHALEIETNPFKVTITLELLSIPYNVKLWEFGDGYRGVKEAPS